MKKFFLSCILLVQLPAMAIAQSLDTATLARLAHMPLENISVEYPNKTGHVIAGPEDVARSPRDLHPIFYGCYDWHSSVHSHWMLAKTLELAPTLSVRAQIVSLFDRQFTRALVEGEARYFDTPLSGSYERTYGWAWLLKLSEQLHRLQSSPDTEIAQKAKAWAENLDLLSLKIVDKWKAYLPKMTYPNRIGTHQNSAFALSFAIDYAQFMGDKAFADALIHKAKELYIGDKKVPAVWEPNGSDFFSPALMTADLMTRVLPQKEYQRWLRTYFTPEGLRRLSEPLIVSDLSDYNIVHLVGLSFSRAWTMARISAYLPETHPLSKRFRKQAPKVYQQGMEQIFRANYGGSHWLGSFACYAQEALSLARL